MAKIWILLEWPSEEGDTQAAWAFSTKEAAEAAKGSHICFDILELELDARPAD